MGKAWRFTVKLDKRSFIDKQIAMNYTKHKWRILWEYNKALY